MDGSEDSSALQEPPDPEVLEVDPTFRYIRVRGISLGCYSFTFEMEHRRIKIQPLFGLFCFSKCLRFELSCVVMYLNVLIHLSV